MVTERTDRGQLILIGAISLAFIILGVVVVFNGVLYTETLSSGGTSQSASQAETVEVEVKQGVGCLLKEIEDDSVLNETILQNHVEENVSKFSDSYRNTTVESTPTAVNVSVDNIELGDLDDADLDNIQGVDVIIRYDSSTLSYRQEKTIVPGDCPS